MIFFAVIGLVCTGFAMYYFTEKNSNLSPAESRELNQPCLYLDFYDG